MHTENKTYPNPNYNNKDLNDSFVFVYTLLWSIKATTSQVIWLIFQLFYLDIKYRRAMKTL